MLTEYQELEMSEALENIQERLGLYAWLFIRDIKKENHTHSHEESIKILALACQKFKHTYMRGLRVRSSRFEEYITLYGWYLRYLRYEILGTLDSRKLKFYVSEMLRIDTIPYMTPPNYPLAYDFEGNGDVKEGLEMIYPI